MPREYRHIKQYENELLDLRNQGLTYKEIADRMDFSKDRYIKRLEMGNKLMRDFLPLTERK